MPSLIVIGGPNGSGKTTLTKYLIEKGRIKSHVINPDDIALNELGSYKHQVKAGKISLERRINAIDQNQDIAFETTFSGQSELNHVKKAIDKGYQTTLYYIALESHLDNIIRIEERQSNRGHNVITEDVVRRHEKSKQNLFANISLFDKVYVFDNTRRRHSRVAIFIHGKLGWLNPKHKQHPFFKDLFNLPPTLPRPRG